MGDECLHEWRTPCTAARKAEERKSVGRLHDGATVRRQDQGWVEVPVSGDAERSLPRARRPKHWSSDGDGTSADQAREDHSWASICEFVCASTRRAGTHALPSGAYSTGSRRVDQAIDPSRPVTFSRPSPSSRLPASGCPTCQTPRPRSCRPEIVGGYCPCLAATPNRGGGWRGCSVA